MTVRPTYDLRTFPNLRRSFTAIFAYHIEIVNSVPSTSPCSFMLHMSITFPSNNTHELPGAPRFIATSNCRYVRPLGLVGALTLDAAVDVCCKSIGKVDAMNAYKEEAEGDGVGSGPLERSKFSDGG